MNIRRIFAVPSLLFTLMLSGLWIALIGDGWWDVAGSIAVTAPLIVAIAAACRHAAAAKSNPGS